MFRVVVPGLLCLLAAPAAAQTPTPQPKAPVPAQPLPVVPDSPPPVTFTFPAMPNGRMQVGGGGGGEPRVVVAKVVDGALVYKSSVMGPVQQAIEVTVLENGQPVRRKQMITTMQPTTRDVSLPLDGLKVKDTAGKKVAPLSLEIKLGDGKGVVLHSGPLPDAIRGMFKDDTLFVELPPGAGQFGQPAFVAPQFIPNNGPPPVLRVAPAPLVEGFPAPLLGQPARPVPPPPPPPAPPPE